MGVFLLPVSVLIQDRNFVLELTGTLSSLGYLVQVFSGAHELELSLRQPERRIVVLDTDAHAGSEHALIRGLAGIPGARVIALSSRAGLEDRVSGLESGADLYFAKPVAADELVAAIRAVQRRGHKTPTATAGAWMLFSRFRQVRSPAGESHALTEMESRVLGILAQSAPEVCSRKALIEGLGYDYLQYDERCLESCVSRLRKKLSAGTGENLLRSVRGGYYFVGIISVL